MYQPTMLVQYTLHMWMTVRSLTNAALLDLLAAHKFNEHAWRQEPNWSEEKMAQWQATTKKLIQRWRSGKARPNKSSLESLLQVLGISHDQWEFMKQAQVEMEGPDESHERTSARWVRAHLDYLCGRRGQLDLAVRKELSEKAELLTKPLKKLKPKLRKPTNEALSR